MITLNLPDAVRLVDEVVEERGRNYRFTDEPMYRITSACVNVLYDLDEDSVELTERNNTSEGKKNFRPGCIVGSAILSTGKVSMNWFFHENLNDGTVFNVSQRLRDLALIDITPLAMRFLRTAQTRQDAGQTWGDSFDSALLGTLLNYRCHHPRPEEEAFALEYDKRG